MKKTDKNDQKRVQNIIMKNILKKVHHFAPSDKILLKFHKKFHFFKDLEEKTF